MNKVLQAAGRVIRTHEDKGIIALLDERFATREYAALFPREWSDLQCVMAGETSKIIDEFIERIYG